MTPRPALRKTKIIATIGPASQPAWCAVGSESYRLRTMRFPALAASTSCGLPPIRCQPEQGSLSYQQGRPPRT